jgi:hypothetical protein
MRKIAVIVVLACATALARRARADEPRFGGRGQVVPSGFASISYTSFSFGGTSSSATGISVGPSLLYFVTDNIGLGGSALFSHFWNDGNASGTSTAYGVAPAAGCNVWLSPDVSLFPQLTIRYLAQNFSAPPPGIVPGLRTISIGLYAPILFHPARHFFLGFGPFFSRDLWSSFDDGFPDAPKVTSIAGQTTFGGYF